MSSSLKVAVALFSGVAFAAGPAPTQEGMRYGSGYNPLTQLVKLSDAQLTQQIVGLAPMQKFTSITRAGKELWKTGDTAAPEATHSERLAIMAVLQRAGAPGSETDFLIAQADGTRLPITVTCDLAGVMTLTSGAAVKDLLIAGSKAEEIAAKYKLDPFLADGTEWKPTELAAVEKALSLLTPDEVTLLGGLAFRRKKNDAGGRSAFYRRADDGMTIDVFDKTFAFDGEYFIGGVDAPTAACVGVLLHEMAHAISDSQGRAKALVANKAVAEAMAAQDAMKADPTPEKKATSKEKGASARELRSAINALDKKMLQQGRAAERSYNAVVDSKVSVSTYGRTSIDENLAESFFLSKLDVKALERVAPTAMAWFQAGTFAKEAQKPLE